MANELLEAALAYAGRGWAVFPVMPNKRPYEGTNGVLDATTNTEQIKKWWATWPRANVAMDVGAAGMMVVDVDSYKPEFDPAKLAALSLPETQLRQRSPRGGDQLFYAIGAGEIVALSSSKLAPCVDVRSFHSYVLLPPSRTEAGAYEWAAEGKPAYRTDEMVRLANTAREKSATRNEWLIEPDLPENVSLAEAWLAKDAKIAVEGQGGDHAAYATAAMMRSFGLSEPMALDAMLRVWNPRCLPEWDADELEVKVANGYRYCTSDPGNITAAYKVAKAQQLFKPVAMPNGGEELRAGRFRIVDRDGMASIRPPSWLLQDFLPRESYAMLVGAPGTYKSFLALDMALSIATGWPVDGLWEVIEPGSVLYAAGEGRSSMANRVAAWEKVHFDGHRAREFFLADPVPNVVEDWEPFIRAALTLRPDGYKLVVIDTVGRAMQGSNENSQEHASKLTAKVEQLQRELGCAVLALHHSGHGNDTRGKGSMEFIGAPDTIVTVKAEDYVARLTNTKQKDAELWKQPKTIKLEEVKLSDGVKSLVAVNPPANAKAAEPQPEQSGERKSHPGRNQYTSEAEQLVLWKLYDEVIESILKGEPGLAQKDLAERMAHDARIDVSSSHLRKIVLTQMRESKATRAHEFYDPRSKKWRVTGMQISGAE